MVEKRSVMKSSAKKWIGHPVCVALKDGSYYVGKITAVKNGEIVLAGIQGTGKISANPCQADKVKINGLLGSLFGGGGANISPAFGGGSPGGAGAAGGGSAGAGLFAKIIPGIRLGFGVLQFIWPLIGKFLI